MPDPSMTPSEAQECRRPARAMTNLTNTNVGHPTKKNSLNALASRTDAGADTAFPASRPESELEIDIDGPCENEGSTRQDISAPPSQPGMKDPRSRAFSAMAVDGSAPPSQNELMQNYRPNGQGAGATKARVDTEDWVVVMIRTKRGRRWRWSRWWRSMYTRNRECLSFRT